MGKKDNNSENYTNGETLDELLLSIECLLFSNDYGYQVEKGDLENILNLVKKLIKFDEDFFLIQEELKVLTERIKRIEKNQE